VAPGPEKSDFRPRPQGKLGLIAITVFTIAWHNALHPHGQPANPLQGVHHPLPLGLQFGLIAHVPELAPAALGEVGAGRLPPGGGGGLDFHRLGPRGALAHLEHQRLAHLAGQGAGDEHHLPIHMGDTLPVDAQGLHRQGHRVVFLHQTAPSFVLFPIVSRLGGARKPQIKDSPQCS